MSEILNQITDPVYGGVLKLLEHTHTISGTEVTTSVVLVEESPFDTLSTGPSQCILIEDCNALIELQYDPSESNAHSITECNICSETTLCLRHNKFNLNPEYKHKKHHTSYICGACTEEVISSGEKLSNTVDISKVVAEII